MHLWFYMFISHLQIYKNTEVETFKDLVWKWRSQVGHQSVHLPWAVSKLTPGRTPGHEVVPHIPCLAPLLVFTDMPRGECTLNMQFHSVSYTHLPREAFYFLYILCVHHPAQCPIHSQQAACHTGNVTAGNSCISSLWFTDAFNNLGSSPPDQGRLNLQPKLPAVLSLAEQTADYPSTAHSWTIMIVLLLLLFHFSFYSIKDWT